MPRKSSSNTVLYGVTAYFCKTAVQHRVSDQIFDVETEHIRLVDYI